MADLNLNVKDTAPVASSIKVTKLEDDIFTRLSTADPALNGVANWSIKIEDPEKELLECINNITGDRVVCTREDFNRIIRGK